VVLNEGRVEQAGAPLDVYDKPATEFVMGFIGPVTELDGQIHRPHDFDLSRDRVDGGVEGLVERVVPLGSEVRVELVLGDASPLLVHTGRDEVEMLELQPGDIVYARPTRRPAARRFAPAVSA